MKKSLFILVLGIMAISAEAQRSEVKYWYIADAKTSCVYRDAITSCLKIKSHPDSLWKDFPYEIEGFIFEQGVETYAQILEKEIMFPEDSGPKFTYHMVKVIESRSTLLRDRRLLANNTWKLISIDEGRTIIPARKANASLVFNTDSNKITGFTGCNQISGNAFIQDGEMAFGVLSSTMMSCANDELEKRIKEALIGRAVFYIRNKVLVVVCENNTTLNFRSEKKLDSLIAAIYRPISALQGNAYQFVKDGHYSVRLDEEAESSKQEMLFKQMKLSVEEKKTVKLKLVNILPEDNIKEVRILKKPHKVKGMSHAVLVFRDGTKRNISIRNVQ